MFLSGGKWATVIASAPSQGLQEGDAVECGPARAAIIEIAVELELAVHYTIEDPGFPNIVWKSGRMVGKCIKSQDARNRTWHTPEVFIAKMRAMKPAEKPITIGEHKVDFMANGDIKVGCTRVEYDTLREVYERATKNKNAK